MPDTAPAASDQPAGRPYQQVQQHHEDAASRAFRADPAEVEAQEEAAEAGEPEPAPEPEVPAEPVAEKEADKADPA